MELFICEKCNGFKFVFYTNGIIECAECKAVIGFPTPENDVLH